MTFLNFVATFSYPSRLHGNGSRISRGRQPERGALTYKFFPKTAWKHITRITVRCVPSAYQPYVCWWPPPGVSTGGAVYPGPIVYPPPPPQTYQTPSGHNHPPWTCPHPLSTYPHPPSGHTTTPWTYPDPLLMTPGGHHGKHTHPPCWWHLGGITGNIAPPQPNDRHLWKHYFPAPATSLAGGNEDNWTGRLGCARQNF